MRKRLLASLMTLCLLAGLLPTVALAGGTQEIIGYEAFKAAVGDASKSDISLNDCTFTWPDTEDTVEININVSLDDSNTWEIPANITLKFGSNGRINSFQDDAELIIRGVVSGGETRNNFNLLWGDGHPCKVRIADGGRVEGDIYIDDRATWIVEEGGTLAADVTLGGTLTGTGGKVTGTVEANNVFATYEGVAGTAVLSGNLELAGGLELPWPNSDSDLIVPEGSHTTLSGGIFRIGGFAEET